MARRQIVSAALSPGRSLALIRRVAGPIWLRVGFVAILTVPGRRTGAGSGHPLPG